MNRLEACLLLESLPGMGWNRAQRMVTHFGSPEAIFLAKHQDWESVEGIGEKGCNALKSWKKGLLSAEKKAREIKTLGIQCLFFGTPEYPLALSFCADAPLVLFYKGTLSFQDRSIVSIVGTRQNTPHGRAFCEELIHTLAPFNPIICSGLARGIGIIAHRAALKANLDTVACLAHSFDRIYPYEHHKTASDIEKKGALVTDFLPGAVFNRANFPRRNRLIAGMAHATVVIESAVKGGSMNTADLAHQYGRELFAVPGRPSDLKSGGCHQLLFQQKAQLLTDPQEIVNTLGWNKQVVTKAIQKPLFVDLTEEERQLFTQFSKEGKIHLDHLAFSVGIKVSTTASLLMQMEMKGMVRALPGKYFEWI